MWRHYSRAVLSCSNHKDVWYMTQKKYSIHHHHHHKNTYCALVTVRRITKVRKNTLPKHITIVSKNEKVNNHNLLASQLRCKSSFPVNLSGFSRVSWSCPPFYKCVGGKCLSLFWLRCNLYFPFNVVYNNLSLKSEVFVYLVLQTTGSGTVRFNPNLYK